MRTKLISCSLIRWGRADFINLLSGCSFCGMKPFPVPSIAAVHLLRNQLTSVSTYSTRPQVAHLIITQSDVYDQLIIYRFPRHSYRCRYVVMITLYERVAVLPVTTTQRYKGTVRTMAQTLFAGSRFLPTSALCATRAWNQ